MIFRNQDIATDFHHLIKVLQESMKERMKDQTEKLFGDGQNDHSSTPSQAS